MTTFASIGHGSIIPEVKSVGFFKPAAKPSRLINDLTGIWSKFDDKNEPSHSKDLLDKISKNWSKAAMVKKRDFDDVIPIFDIKRDDFREDLLPFKDSEIYRNASEVDRKKLLTCGWLIYNEKVLAVETEVVTPACMDIIQRKIPGLTGGEARSVAAETMVDEAYHSHMVLRANQITKEMRNIDINISGFGLPVKMQQYKDSLDSQWKKDLTQAATAIVAEAFISDFLFSLSDDHTIQPMNRLVVETHVRDELMHGHVFKLLAKELYRGLDAEQRRFFASVLPKPVRWFADKELGVWESVLAQIGFKNSKEMIAECKRKNDDGLKSIDYRGVITLASEIGVTGTPEGIRAFEAEGLISPTGPAPRAKL